MPTLAKGWKRAGVDNGPSASLVSLGRRWLGPAAILVAGIASLAWAQMQKPLPAALPPLCGLADQAPAPEAPFLIQNDMAMTKMLTTMTVRPTGDVDHDFVEMMVPHHRAAIDMAQALLRYGHSELLRRLAQEIIVTQQEEIAAMRLALGEPLPPSIASPDQPSDFSATSSTARP